MVWGTGFLKGMAVTLRNAFRGPVTINYPEERMRLPERARGAVAPLFDEDGAPTCTACMICVHECPDGVLQLDFETGEEKSKRIISFTYEVGACMFCGLCVEKCPFDALEMSHEYELASPDVRGLSYALLEDVPAASPKRRRQEGPAREPEGGDTDA